MSLTKLIAQLRGAIKLAPRIPISPMKLPTYDFASNEATRAWGPDHLPLPVCYKHGRVRVATFSLSIQPAGSTTYDLEPGLTLLLTDLPAGAVLLGGNMHFYWTDGFSPTRYDGVGWVLWPQGIDGRDNLVVQNPVDYTETTYANSDFSKSNALQSGTYTKGPPIVNTWDIIPAELTAAQQPLMRFMTQCAWLLEIKLAATTITRLSPFGIRGYFLYSTD